MNADYGESPLSEFVEPIVEAEAQIFRFKLEACIKRFLGTSENAVKAQIWCAVSNYALIAIVKNELQLDASLYTLLQILSVSVFEKIQLSCA